jgi:hypothetical protein
MQFVMARRWIGILNLLGLACGVIGGVLLAYSLDLKPSNFRLVEGKDRQVANVSTAKK